MSGVYVQKSDNFIFKCDTTWFIKINKWEIIWVDWTKNIYAEFDMILVMPNLQENEKWIERYFIWKTIN
jgi:hypothetical protein